MAKELSKIMAKKVMGWTQRQHPYYKDQKRCWYKTHKRGWMWKINCEDWNPAERIDQAFEVVEKMIKGGYEFELSTLPRTSLPNRFNACFWTIPDSVEGIVFENNNTTPAMAICLATKKAMEERDG